MGSETDVGNLALSHLGDSANVSSFSPPTGSPQAEHCARFYPIARDTMLESFAWTFATTTATLAPSSYAVDGWRNTYILPNGCLRPLIVYPPGGRRALGEFSPWYRTYLEAPGLWNDPVPNQFDVETDPLGQPILLTDVDGAILRYVQKVTDTNRFTPLFTDALSWLLASMLAGPVLKGDTGVAAAKTCWQTFLMRFGQATTADANKSRVRLDPVPAWVGNR